MDNTEVCDSWEQIDENPELLERQLAKITIAKRIVPKESGVTVSNESDNGKTRQIKIMPRQDNSGTSTTTTTTSTVSVSTDGYVPSTNSTAQPKLKILSRPKHSSSNSNSNSSGPGGKKQSQTKTLQQREQEYAEARMRILGDVRFLKEEKEAELESMLSPAEILKLKINEAMSPPGANNVNGPNKQDESDTGALRGSKTIPPDP